LSPLVAVPGEAAVLLLPQPEIAKTTVQQANRRPKTLRDGPRPRDDA
jgi:hypothetical protein